MRALRARTRIALVSAIAGLGAITLYAGVGEREGDAAAASPDVFALDTDCSPAGEPAGLPDRTGAHRTVPLGGRELLLAAELAPADRPASVVAAVASSADGRAVVQVVDVKGDDRLELSADGGITWRQITTGADIRSPAVSASGDDVAFTVAGALLVASARDGWTPTPVPPPELDKAVAEYVRFVGDDRLVLTLEAGVDGVDEHFAALSDVWTYDMGARAWQRHTSGIADADRWSLAMTPYVLPDGSMLYVRQTGLGSGTLADIRTELRRIPAPGVAARAETVLTAVPDRWGIVSVEPDGSIVWNAPDDLAQWQLVRRDVDGTMTSMGCGRTSWAIPLNHDPDRTP